MYRVKICTQCPYERGDVAECYDSNARHYLCGNCPERAVIYVKRMPKVPRFKRTQNVLIMGSSYAPPDAVHRR